MLESSCTNTKAVLNFCKANWLGSPGIRQPTTVIRLSCQAYGIDVCLLSVKVQASNCYRDLSCLSTKPQKAQDCGSSLILPCLLSLCRYGAHAVTYLDLGVDLAVGVPALLQVKAQLAPFPPNAACAPLAHLQCRLQMLPGRMHRVTEHLIWNLPCACSCWSLSSTRPLYIILCRS